MPDINGGGARQQRCVVRDVLVRVQVVRATEANHIGVGVVDEARWVGVAPAPGVEEPATVGKC